MGAKSAIDHDADNSAQLRDVGEEERAPALGGTHSDLLTAVLHEDRGDVVVDVPEAAPQAPRALRVGRVEQDGDVPVRADRGERRGDGRGIRVGAGGHLLAREDQRDPQFLGVPVVGRRRALRLLGAVPGHRELRELFDRLVDPAFRGAVVALHPSGEPMSPVLVERPAYVGMHFVDPRMPLSPAPTKVARIEITLAPQVLDRYVGDYELAPAFHIVVTRDGSTLYGQPTGQDKVQLFAEKEDEFFLKVVDAQITFSKDSSGNVTGLVLHQNGQESPGKKVK